MIENGDGFALIDGEHSSANLPYLFDVAYMYKELFTAGKSPDLAREFLRRVKNGVSGLNGRFEDELRPVLAGETIGQYFGALSLGNMDLTYQKMLKDAVLSDSLT